MSLMMFKSLYMVGMHNKLNREDVLLKVIRWNTILVGMIYRGLTIAGQVDLSKWKTATNGLHIPPHHYQTMMGCKPAVSRKHLCL